MPRREKLKIQPLRLNSIRPEHHSLPLGLRPTHQVLTPQDSAVPPLNAQSWSTKRKHYAAVLLPSQPMLLPHFQLLQLPKSVTLIRPLNILMELAMYTPSNAVPNNSLPQLPPSSLLPTSCEYDVY